MEEVNRESRISIINSRLIMLDNVVNKLQDFVIEIDTPVPTAVNAKEPQQPNPSFTELYTGIPDRIESACAQIENSVEKLKNVIF